MCVYNHVFWLNYPQVGNAKMFGPWKQSMKALHKSCAINYIVITFNYYPEA